MSDLLGQEPFPLRRALGWVAAASCAALFLGTITIDVDPLDRSFPATTVGDDRPAGEGGPQGVAADANAPVPRVIHDEKRHQLVFTPGGVPDAMAYRYRIGADGPVHQTNSDSTGLLRVSVPATLDDTVAHPVVVQAQDGKGTWSAGRTAHFTFLNRNPGATDLQVQRLESEAMTRDDTSRRVLRVQRNQRGLRFSGGAQTLVDATAPGGTHTLDFTVRTPGEFRLALKQTLGRTYGIASFTLDGKPLGGARDGYAKRPGSRAVRLGLHVLKAGKHRLGIEVRGKNPRSAGHRVGVDYLELSPALLREAEDITPLGRAGRKAAKQTDCCGVHWSGGAQLAFRAQRRGDSFTLPFHVQRAAWYAVGTEQTTGPDHGRVEYALDGTKLTALREQPSGERLSTTPVDLGIHYLKPGRHLLTLTAASVRDPRIGVDLLKVFPLSGSYEAEVVTSRATGRTGIQRNCCTASWSGRHQRLLSPAAPGDEVDLSFAVPLDGPHSLNVAVTRHPDFGRVRFAIDGKPVGAVLDGHSSRPTTDSVHLGTHDFTEGLHRLTLTVEARGGGRADAGVDRIDLYPEGETP
ncbi:hypothetical protein ACIBI4_19745 [Streptomyces sp. NPDC050418]|uniref:hypothetical protein n=1 Tax=Streptomyces sp. NPDC050418 TaxID=3365612 RepID=UPI00378DCB3D